MGTHTSARIRWQLSATVTVFLVIMDDVVIFSPHCDDVPLSIGGVLLGGTLGKAVHVEVVFSISRYSLSNSIYGQTDEVTRTRRAEELAAAEVAGYDVNFMGFPEPFVRSGYGDLRDVFDPNRRPQNDPILPRVKCGFR
jgi:LmbE family N-acetylglucosaminyl deacetylase